MQAQIGAASAGFDNPSATATKGRQEATAKASYKVSDSTTLKAELLRSDDLVTSARRSGVQVSVEHALNSTVRGELAVRHSSGSDLNAPATDAVLINAVSTTVLAKLTSLVPGAPDATELGYLLSENLWLSLGWNVFGFTDSDLTAQDNT